MRKLIPKTWQEALERWDAGESVFTVEMGGFGPGYEHCIQATAFDLLRHQKKHDCLKPRAKKFPPCWEKAILESDKTWGLSGAQAGAAKSLASLVILNGYAKFLADPSVKDRLIQDKKEPFKEKRSRTEGAP